MAESKSGVEDQEKQQNLHSYRVRLPGFIKDDEVGLGEVVKRATYTLGIRPCGGCQKRATAMNRWLTFTR